MNAGPRIVPSSSVLERLQTASRDNFRQVPFGRPSAESELSSFMKRLAFLQEQSFFLQERSFFLQEHSDFSQEHSGFSRERMVIAAEGGVTPVFVPGDMRVGLVMGA